MADIIGRVIGNHRVAEKIADGVTGAVYKAEHTVIGRHVAIKFLRSEYSSDPDLVKRYFNVLRQVSAIEHPSIVQIFDFGYFQDAAYLVMEFMEFETLDQRLRRLGRMRMSFTLDIVSQIADTLNEVHRRGVIHEDLKPSNIALVPDPAVPGGARAKLLDFGLATLYTDTGTGARKVRNEAELPTYSAPEQLVGQEDVDRRADLYALGCIWYEMLCGRPPFVSKDLLELVDLLLGTEPPKPRSLIATISEPVEEVILRLLAKDREARYQSAKDLMQAIDGLHDDFMSELESSLGNKRPSLAKISFSSTASADKIVSKPELESIEAHTGRTPVQGTATEKRSGVRPALLLALVAALVLALAAFALL